MKLTGPDAIPPPESVFLASAQRREVRSRAGAPLEEHSFGARQPHDRFHVVANRIDEARRALRFRLHAHVEPHRRIEAHLLFDQQVRQLVAERFARLRICKIPALLAHRTMVLTTRPISCRADPSR